MEPRAIELSALLAPFAAHIPPEKKQPHEPVKQVEPKERATMEASGDNKRGVYTQYEPPIIFNERQRRYIHSLLQRWDITNYEELELLAYLDTEKKKIVIEIRTKKDKRLIKRFYLDEVKDIDSHGIIIDKKV
jgi:hypothetical protein